MEDGSTGPLTGEQFEALLRLIDAAAHAAVSGALQRNSVLREVAENGRRDAAAAARRSLVADPDA